MQRNIQFISWFSLAAALGAWALVGFGAMQILGAADARANEARLAMTQTSQAALNARVQSLEEGTREKREQLNMIASADAVTIVEAIEAAGAQAGIEAKVSGATAAGSTKLTDTESLGAVVFNVQGTGSFSQVLHAAELYETLPLLSTIESVDMERILAPDGRSARWVLTARIRVLTTVPIAI